MLTVYGIFIILCSFFSFPELPFFHALMFVALQSVNRNPYSLLDFVFLQM